MRETGFTEEPMVTPLLAAAYWLALIIRSDYPGAVPTTLENPVESMFRYTTGHVY